MASDAVREWVTRFGGDDSESLPAPDDVHNGLELVVATSLAVNEATACFLAIVEQRIGWPLGHETPAEIGETAHWLNAAEYRAVQMARHFAERRVADEIQRKRTAVLSRDEALHLAEILTGADIAGIAVEAFFERLVCEHLGTQWCDVSMPEVAAEPPGH